MTTTDRLIEISRHSLKALLAEYQAAGNHANAIHALSALKEIEKIGPLNVAWQDFAPSVYGWEPLSLPCGDSYKGALSGNIYACQEAHGHYPATRHRCGSLTWSGSGLAHAEVEGVPIYDPLPSDEDSGEPDNWAGLLCSE